MKLKTLKQFVKKTASRHGVHIGWYPQQHEVSDLTPAEHAIVDSVREYTMTSTERLASLIHSVRYIVQNRVPGDIVECGVWRGGSMMVVAKCLKLYGDESRQLFLYDTFEGMSAPTSADVTFDQKKAADMLTAPDVGAQVACVATLEDVKGNLTRTGYPLTKMHFIKGKVEDTIPQAVPSSIALLRLDTDWYESTRHELRHLFPRLAEHGLLILDDYGYWQGARQATDEYFAEFEAPVYLGRIDFSGRIVVNNPALSRCARAVDSAVLQTH